MKRASDAAAVFLIHFARLKREAGPFVLSGLAYPTAMFLFASAVSGEGLKSERSTAFLAGAITFSLSLTAISWLGYLLLENRFMGRLRLFATLPLHPSSYLFGILAFAVVQAVLGITVLMAMASIGGIEIHTNFLLLTVVIITAMLCLSGISVLISTKARSFSEGTLFTDLLGAGMVFLAPVFYPATTLPAPVRNVVAFLPTSIAADVIRDSLTGVSAPRPALFLLMAMAGLSLAVAFRVLRWRED